MFEKLRPDGDKSAEDDVTRHLAHFASLGLRTLVLAKKTLTDAKAVEWLERYKAAATAMSNRDAELAAVASEIERNLDLVGATAVEDKLQEGVPETISMLQRAKIKVWMLTGDKQETAINIGYASKLLTDSMAAGDTDALGVENRARDHEWPRLAWRDLHAAARHRALARVAVVGAKEDLIAL